MIYFKNRHLVSACLVSSLFLVNQAWAAAEYNDSNGDTKWGLGASAGIVQKPYTGYGTDYLALPMLFVDNKWVRVGGLGMDLKLGKIDDFYFTLNAKLGVMDGYKSSDASILNGMAERKGGIWIGPSVTWKNDLGRISAKILVDASSYSSGTQASIEASKPYKYGKFNFTPHLGITWLSSKYVDYYYGVEANEAQVGRAAYTGTSTVNLSAGIRSDYNLTNNQSLTLDIGFTRFGSGITDSSLVDTTIVPEARIGYLYRF